MGIALSLSLSLSPSLGIADALVVHMRASPATVLHVAVVCAYVIRHTGRVHHLALALEGPRTAVIGTQAIHATAAFALCLDVRAQ